MQGVVFEEQAQSAPVAPNRADVACFVGFVARRTRTDRSGARVPSPSILPRSGRRSTDAPLYRWLEEQGFTRRGADLYSAAGGTRRMATATLAPLPAAWTQADADLDQLLDVPVPIESWESFDRLFAWDARPLRDATPEENAPLRTLTYLGAAVRSFFAQGGRSCYVVRVGEPWPYDAAPEQRRAALAKLLPGFQSTTALSAVDRTTWHGIGHLFGLPDVSFVCVPDLADVVAAAPPEKKAEDEEETPVPERFVECSTRVPVVSDEPKSARKLPAPRADAAGYALWAAFVRALGELAQRQLREVQVVAAIPLPAAGIDSVDRITPERNLLGWLQERGWLAGTLNAPASGESFASAFVQLAFPWVRTLGSAALPEALESPDALLVGVLARNALEHGSYRSAAGQPLAEVHAVEPGLRGSDLELGEQARSLVQRVSLLGPTVRGMRLLSDVTTSRDEEYRQAHVNRLISAIVRAARRLGEDGMFEVSAPRLWDALSGSLTSLLTGLWHDGALRGRTPAEAFSVRCDRSTMSQQDLDGGRVLAEVSFDPTAAIERIRVVLVLSEGNTTAQARQA